MRSYENILLRIVNGICYITINRPDKLNALNKRTILELNDAFTFASTEKEVNVIILTGAGPKAFVAGADIAEFSNFTVEQGSDLSSSGQHLLFDHIEKLNKPVIAAINGFALGGGLELAMSCHIRLASDNAKMGLPEVSLGVIPGYGGTQRLPQLVGKSKAMEMILTAEMISAEEGLRYGLVNYVVPADQLLFRCEEIAEKIKTRSPLALSSAIKAVNAGFTHEVNGFRSEIEEFGKCFGTKDFREGTSAFLERRKPVFPGN